VMAVHVHQEDRSASAILDEWQLKTARALAEALASWWRSQGQNGAIAELPSAPAPLAPTPHPTRKRVAKAPSAAFDAKPPRAPGEGLAA
jgi:hypothetical protein